MQSTVVLSVERLEGFVSQIRAQLVDYFCTGLENAYAGI